MAVEYEGEEYIVRANCTELSSLVFTKMTKLVNGSVKCSMCGNEEGKTAKFTIHYAIMPLFHGIQNLFCLHWQSSGASDRNKKGWHPESGSQP